ncbi:flagellar assembly protein FliW [bacterium]|nr:flagellar assembly protein FliW [bacterium]
MKIGTKAFGEIEIPKDYIIHIKEGLIGFEEIKEYVLLDAGKESPFKWLQSLKEPDLAFVTIPPTAFRLNYKLAVDKNDLAAIGLKDPKEATPLAICVIPHDDPSKMTANLQAPVIINSEKKIGKQVISTNQKHTLRHYIIEEMETSFKKETKEGGEQ